MESKLTLTMNRGIYVARTFSKISLLVSSTMYLEYHSRNILVSEVVLRSRRRLIYTTIEFKIIKSERDFDLVMYHIQSQLNIDEEFSLDFS